MAYDDERARAYDRTHPDEMAAAPGVVAALGDLATLARARDGRRHPVLELGVGTGRLALPLAERGFEVWGIDDSPAMVARLRDKPGGEAVRVVPGDFAALDGLVQGPFGLVFVAFNTLFELASQDAQVSCFTGVARVLSPGGLFAVEALAPDVTRLDQTVAATHVDGTTVRIQATRHDPTAQVVTGADICFSGGGCDVTPWSIRYATVAEMDLMARLAGLVLRDRWASWHGHPFESSSPRHVSVWELPRP